MTDKLINANFGDFNILPNINPLNHNNLIQNHSPSQFNSQNISYYQNNNSFLSSSLNNRQINILNQSQIINQSIDQQNISNQESTPIMNLNLNQNTPEYENKKEELPEKTNIDIAETKNTSKLNPTNLIEIVPQIQNIVSTADLKCNLNLKEIALQEQNVEYNPKRFSGLIMKIKNPKATALIFSNGKIVCLGAKTEEDSKAACHKFGKIIKSLGYHVVLKDFKIQNIVGSCNVKFPIPLPKLYNYILKYMKSNVSYEPELFPGLIYHFFSHNLQDNNEKEKKPNIVFLIFSSGNIVIAGAKNRHQIYEAFSKVYPVLNKFK